jgi:FlaA1/EpsC-like NDP-sugar epimerase
MSPRVARIAKPALLTALVMGGFVLAYLLRFDFAPDPLHQRLFVASLPWAVLAKVGALAAFGLFGNWWLRYVGIPDLLRIAGATTAGSVVTAVLVLRLVTGFPRSVIAIDWALSTLLLAGAAAASRVVRELGMARFGRRGTAVLIVGAGEAGVRLVGELRRNRQLGRRPVGFVDDDPAKVGGWVQGLRVLGTRADIPAIVTRHRVAEAVIAIPSAGRPAVRGIVEACKAAQVPASIMPPTRDILARDPDQIALRRVQIEDLLGRAQVRFERAFVAPALAGRTVLVTGAGGSIGTELARQVASCAPARLVLLDRYENGLYYLVRELAERLPDVLVVPVVADVTDREGMGAVFATHAPHVVFHAAALKHVPLVEENPGEGVRNNVVGTRLVAELAQAHRVERFVFISTDKAIRPKSVMGCTKRVAELVLQAMQRPEGTRFVTVRFGNVLGSEGSVVPLFHRQIARGGPVTVTHPDAVRYFMLVPEAVHLVLHAGVLGAGGEIFFLDMGEPVRILDLAIDMIRLSGLRPFEDVDIRFTGLWPGEKLAEELRGADETLDRTEHENIRMLRNGHPPRWTALQPLVADLERVARRGSAPAIRACLARIVPEYTGVERDDVAIVVEPGLRRPAADRAVG